MRKKRATKKQQAAIDAALAAVYWGRGRYPVKTYQQGDWRTLSQWAAAGRFVYFGQPAVYMWSSQMCKGSYCYYHISQTEEDWETVAQVLGRTGLKAVIKTEKGRLEEMQEELRSCSRRLEELIRDKKPYKLEEDSQERRQREIKLQQLTIEMLQAWLEKDSTPADTLEEYKKRSCYSKP